MINGKAIKMPEGAAGEYAKYACNFYKGCSNGCTYCFNKRWGWGNVPTLNKCFKDEEHALEVFEKELMANLPELQEHGLFFTFTGDWALKECINLTIEAVNICVYNNIHVKLLSKMGNFQSIFDVDWCRNRCKFHRGYENPLCRGCLNLEFDYNKIGKWKKYVSFGFTLTGHDELEPSASPNADRIEAMKKLHDAGFKTWASIEPIIDFQSSYDMIVNTVKFCDLYKIGLQSGKKYLEKDTLHFIGLLTGYLPDVYNGIIPEFPKIYFKDSLLKAAGINRSDLPNCCIGRDWNIFNH